VRRLAGHDKSSKHRKAEELIAKSQPIRILGESDFRRIVLRSNAAVGGRPS
jgi:DNA polymerase-3 subunit epsilon